IHEDLVRAHPAVTDYRSGLAFALTGLGRAHFRAGRPAEASGPLRRAVALRDELPRMSFEARYDLACSHALLAALVAEAGSEQGSGESQREADSAMTALRQAVEAGYRDLAHLRSDPDLDPLRRRPDFRLLMMDLAMPAEPFARVE